MIAKLLALLPLLGWFYISAFGIACVSYLLSGKARRRYLQLVVVLCVLAASYLSYQSIRQELSFLPEVQKTIKHPFREKIIETNGGEFELYYEKIRPLLEEKERVYLVGQHTKIYHYARMYLYPHGVSFFDTLQMPFPGVYIMSDGEEKNINKSDIIYRGSGIIAVRVNNPVKEQE